MYILLLFKKQMMNSYFGLNEIVEDTNCDEENMKYKNNTCTYDKYANELIQLEVMIGYVSEI